MRFPDGAVRPAYNAQIAAAPKEGVIVSIEVTDRRNTQPGEADGRRHRSPLWQDARQAHGRHGYATSEDIVALAAHARGRLRSIRRRRAKGTMWNWPVWRRRRKREKPACLKAWRSAWRAKRQGRLRLAPAHRADQRRPQEPWLWFSCRSRSDQGEGPCALACAREQSHGRSPSEDPNPMRRSTSHPPSPFRHPNRLHPRASDFDLKARFPCGSRSSS